MAIDFITIDRTKKLGNDLNSMVTVFRGHQDILKQLKEIMDNMTDGIDYTNIEAQFGLPAGKGQTTYNLLAGALVELNGDVSFNQMIDWLVPQN